jgi:hypothetical protein
MHFGKWLDYRLKQTKITRAMLCENVKNKDGQNINRSTVSLWINGERTPDHKMLRQVVDYLCTTQPQRKRAIFAIYYDPDKVGW